MYVLFLTFIMSGRINWLSVPNCYIYAQLSNVNVVKRNTSMGICVGENTVEDLGSLD